MVDESTAKPEPQPPPGGGKSYRVGDIGANARVAIGENITWTEGLKSYPGADQLKQELFALVDEIGRDPNLPEAERVLASTKTQAVADALPVAQKEPQRLHAALLDAQVFLAARAGWAWERLRSALSGETAAAIISGIAEGTVKGAIRGLLGT